MVQRATHGACSQEKPRQQLAAFCLCPFRLLLLLLLLLLQLWMLWLLLQLWVLWLLLQLRLLWLLLLLMLLMQPLYMPFAKLLPLHKHGELNVFRRASLAGCCCCC